MADSDIQIKIADARNTLERVIGFVGNCDTKVTTFLALVGVILTIFTTSDLAKEFFIMLVIIYKKNTCTSVAFLLAFTCNIFIFIHGCFNLIMALKATVPLSGNDSKIYFTDIAHNANAHLYQEKFLSQTEEEQLKDLTNQIYINSVICTKKYNNFNSSMRKILLSSFCFILLIGMGMFLK